jgi:hypothetical protein
LCDKLSHRHRTDKPQGMGAFDRVPECDEEPLETLRDRLKRDPWYRAEVQRLAAIRRDLGDAN